MTNMVLKMQNDGLSIRYEVEEFNEWKFTIGNRKNTVTQ